MERKYTKNDYERITSRQRNIVENGVEIRVYPLPDRDNEGMPAPEFKKLMSKPTLLKLLNKILEKNLIKNPARVARKPFNQITSIPIVSSVDTIELTVKGKGGDIPVKVFVPKKREKNLSVFYYIHGGGFFGGSAECASESCRLVCEKTNCVGVTLNYRLAPENPFPCGLEDCYTVLEWIYENIGEYGGDKHRICISGDSAGGNLAAVCTIKSRDENTNMVASQALLYPTINIARDEDEFCNFGIDVFEKEVGWEKGIKEYIKLMAGAMNLMPLVLKTDNLSDPYVTPYNADLHKLPPCLIIYGEFDFLRIENEAFARKLLSNGVYARLVRFSGFSHAILNPIGSEPQAEICVSEISEFMIETLEKSEEKL